MDDSSWDNGGLPPRKQGTSTGMKVLMGCGIAAVLLLATCVIGGAVLRNVIRKDPKAFEKRVEGFAKGLVQKDWEHLRALLDQLQTDEGARAVYRANPGLREAHPAEDQFLQAVRGWRPRLGPLPAEIPMSRRRHRHREDGEPGPGPAPESGADSQPKVDIQKVFGTTKIQCRYPGGALLSVTFDGDRVTRLDVE